MQRGGSGLWCTMTVQDRLIQSLWENPLSEFLLPSQISLLFPFIYLFSWGESRWRRKCWGDRLWLPIVLPCWLLLTSWLLSILPGSLGVPSVLTTSAPRSAVVALRLFLQYSWGLMDSNPHPVFPPLLSSILPIDAPRPLTWPSGTQLWAVYLVLCWRPLSSLLQLTCVAGELSEGSSCSHFPTGEGWHASPYLWFPAVSGSFCFHLLCLYAGLGGELQMVKKPVPYFSPSLPGLHSSPSPQRHLFFFWTEFCHFPKKCVCWSSHGDVMVFEEGAFGR